VSSLCTATWMLFFILTIPLGCGRSGSASFEDVATHSPVMADVERLKLPPLCRSVLICCDAVVKSDVEATKKSACQGFGRALIQLSQHMNQPKMEQICKSLVLTLGREVGRLPRACKELEGFGGRPGEPVHHD
jgi:hypothetical protein